MLKRITLSIVADVLEAFGFSTIEQYEAMIERCWRRSVELADARRELDLEKKGVDELIAEQARQVRWTDHFASQNKRLREFVSEIAATTGPNAPKFGAIVHNLDRLHEAAIRVLKENREPERDDV